jgi:class 3 adenylate cyclase
MSATYVTFMQNDIRALQISVRDQYDTVYPITSATVKVLTSIINHHGGDVVLPESAALVASNTVSALMTTTVTSAAGEYDVVWKLVKVIGATTYNYYHKTKLKVEEI